MADFEKLRMYIVIIEQPLKMHRGIIKNPRDKLKWNLKNIHIIRRNAGKEQNRKQR